MKVESVEPSTCTDYEGAVDAEIVFKGNHYGVTLVPDYPCNGGELTSWGSLDHWISGPCTEDLTQEELEEIIAHVREAWRKEKDSV